MARLIIGGNPGSRYTNTTGKVLYQLIVQFDSSCGVCVQYANKVGDSWPIPFHRGCRCTQRPIYPGQTSEPFLDFREEIRKLDIAQQNRVMGAANYRLVESGVVKYEDVVTERRVRNLREVVARQKLTVDQMTRAGVPKRDASEAYNAVHTGTHTATEQRRQQLIDKLMSAGYTGDQIKTTVGQQLATRLSQVNYANRPVVPIVPKDGKFKLPIPTNRVVPQRVEAVSVTELAKALVGRKFADMAAMDAWGKEHFGKWADGLSKAERDELKNYTETDFTSINRRLRTGGRLYQMTEDEFDEKVKQLDSALSKAEVPEPVIAYRGVIGDFAKKLGESKPGEVVTDLGYSSTSLREDKAVEFGGDNGISLTSNTMMRISVPKGAKGAYLNAARISTYTGENELLLMRGTKFRVIKTEKTGKDSYIVEAEIIP